MEYMLKKGNKLTDYKPGVEIVVSDLMQKNYRYTLSDTPLWKNNQVYKPRSEKAIEAYNKFRPEYSPEEMLKLGVFEGKYMNDCIDEFPKSWYSDLSKFSPEGPDVNINYYKIYARTSLQAWREADWIFKEDPRGWFQWYCRFYIGRRSEAMDIYQIGRWKNLGSRMKGMLRKFEDNFYNIEDKLVMKGYSTHDIKILVGDSTLLKAEPVSIQDLIKKYTSAKKSIAKLKQILLQWAYKA